MIDLLYEGAIKQLKLAELALDKKEFEQVNTHLIKAEDIILELKLSVNPAVEGEVPNQLIELYDFMFSRLVTANIEKNLELIQLVRGMIEELRETWAQL
ncbi:flagellar export chaperone FliS [Vagococcus penaei]|nr:flagellar export chaperone FliS [Vagococcus penaei]